MLLSKETLQSDRLQLVTISLKSFSVLKELENNSGSSSIVRTTLNPVKGKIIRLNLSILSGISTGRKIKVATTSRDESDSNVAIASVLFIIDRLSFDILRRGLGPFADQ